MNVPKTSALRIQLLKPSVWNMIAPCPERVNFSKYLTSTKESPSSQAGSSGVKWKRKKCNLQTLGMI
jgi:hypothetical protein